MPTGVYQRTKEHIMKMSTRPQNFKKGHTVTKETREKISIARKGIVFSEETKSKMSKSMQGRTVWNKGKKFDQIANEKNYGWKGNKVSYSGLHQWVTRKLGNPELCSNCETEGKYIIRKNGRKMWNIQWANKSKSYLRDLNDWVALCTPCHRSYDNLSKNGYQLSWQSK